MTPEDEAFAEIERKQNALKISIKTELNPYAKQVRNDTIEEVAKKLEEEFRIPFAQDTVASFAAFIREMKE